VPPVLEVLPSPAGGRVNSPAVVFFTARRNGEKVLLGVTFLFVWALVMFGGQRLWNQERRGKSRAIHAVFVRLETTWRVR
jgi:hypothetical protein